VRRREKLADLKLSEGDVVETVSGDYAEVSSIGQDGRVSFKGGRGFGTWPDLASLVVRGNDSSKVATEARRRAENVAALRISSSGWSMARSQDLRDFAVEHVASEEDITELEDVIARAEDEHPIQKFFEENPHVITLCLGGANGSVCRRSVSVVNISPILLSVMLAHWVFDGCWLSLKRHGPRSTCKMASVWRRRRERAWGRSWIGEIGCRAMLPTRVSPDPRMGLASSTSERKPTPSSWWVEDCGCQKLRMLNDMSFGNRTTFRSTAMTGCLKRFVALSGMGDPLEPTHTSFHAKRIRQQEPRRRQGCRPCRPTRRCS
jgi:hypothetical protein